MKRLLAAVAVVVTVALMGLSSWALTPAQQIVVLGGYPTSYDPKPDATWYFDAATNTCLVNKVSTPVTTCITTTRTSGAYAKAAGPYGIWTLVGAGITRAGTAGLPNEGLRTTIISKPRDCSDIAWVKGLSIVCALTATGIDGIANSASRITTTDVNQTITIVTVSSSPRWGTVWLKCNTACTGTVGMSIDTVSSGYTVLNATNCVNSEFQPTPINTTGFVQCSVPTQNLTNKTNGLQFSASGADYSMDFFQNENSGTFATTPIPTASATRQADNSIIADISMMNLAQGGWYAKYGPIWGTGAIFREVIQMKVDASNKAGIELSGNSTAPAITSAPQSYVFAVAFTTQLSSQIPISSAGIYKTAFGYQNLACSAAANSPSVGAGIIQQCGGASLTGAFAVTPGSNAGGQNLFGQILQLAYVPTRPPNANLLGYANSP